MRGAFTLLEMLVVIALIGLLAGFGAVSISSGKGAARVKGATRDIFAAIRHARSTALVTGEPAIITYSTVMEDGEVMAKVALTSAKLFEQATRPEDVQTLSGEPVRSGSAGDSAPTSVTSGSRGGKGASSKLKPEPEDESAGGEGDSLADILFAPVDTEVVKGMRLKVQVGDEDLRTADTGRKTKISVFSNVDYLLGRYQDAKAEAKKKEAEEKAKAQGTGELQPADEPLQAEVSVVWETNGRVEPHRVWVYSDGAKPEDGLLIQIDRFGAAKILSGDGREDD